MANMQFVAISGPVFRERPGRTQSKSWPVQFTRN